MTHIQTQPATGASVTFFGIPSGLSRLLLDIAGVSATLASAQLRYEFSPDGVTWTAPAVLGPGFAATAAHHGRIAFADPDAAIGVVTGAQGAVPATALGAATAISAVRNSGAAIGALRISWSNGAIFDAGSFTLSGE